jgi:hypothetical protein
MAPLFNEETDMNDSHAKCVMPPCATAPQLVATAWMVYCGAPKVRVVAVRLRHARRPMRSSAATQGERGAARIINKTPVVAGSSSTAQPA